MNVGQVVVPNAKGQIVIPWRMREDLGIDENTQLQIVTSGQSVVMYPLVGVVRRNRMGRETFREVLARTAGAWGPATKEDLRLEKARRKRELAASKRRAKAW